MLIFVFKTQFAQEKWLRKKMAKYVSFFRIVKPTGAAISRAFYAKVCLETEFTFFIFIQKKKDPYRVERLRWDALAWMLNAADLRHGSKVWKMCVFSLFRSKRDLKALGD